MANSRTTDCLLTVNGQVPSHRLPHHIATSRNPSSQPPPRYNRCGGEFSNKSDRWQSWTTGSSNALSLQLTTPVARWRLCSVYNSWALTPTRTGCINICTYFVSQMWIFPEGDSGEDLNVATESAMLTWQLCKQRDWPNDNYRCSTHCTYQNTIRWVRKNFILLNKNSSLRGRLGSRSKR